MIRNRSAVNISPGNDSRTAPRTHLGPLTCDDGALFTDLYELTMAASYFREGMTGDATFSLFVRDLPRHRGFLVAAGLEQTLDYLRSVAFSDSALGYLDGLSLFDQEFLDHLSTIRFQGGVRAVREGTVLFPNEPILEITAPIIQAQLVETAVLHLCHLHTVLASKAARVVMAARGRPIIEFGLRRSPGWHAGLAAARAAYMVGAASTSNVLAGLHDGIPIRGTMAHSYVTAFPSEAASFAAFARSYRGDLVLLIDTYDTLDGARRAIEIGKGLRAQGRRLHSVRLDSGDLGQLSQQVRRLLDDAGFTDVGILASGGIDECLIEELLEQGAPIDAFGVGTRMNTSADAPYLDMAYKLVRYDNRDVLKLSGGKETWTGEKQVFRVRRDSGELARDIIALREEHMSDRHTEALLQLAMQHGRAVRGHPTLESIRSHCAAQLAALPADVCRLRSPAHYPVTFSDRLVELQRSVREETRRRECQSGRPSMTAVS